MKSICTMIAYIFVFL